MRSLKGFVAIVALAHFAATIWHLYLAGVVNPALPVAQSVRIAAIAGAVTLAGIGLLWTRLKKIGSLVLILVFVNGLVIGSLEHFFVAGPNNVFDVGSGGSALLFKISVALLLVLEFAGLWGAGRMLIARSATESGLASKP